MKIFEMLGLIGLNLIKGLIYLFGFVYRNFISTFISLLIQGLKKGVVIIIIITFIILFGLFIFKYVLGV